MNRRLSAHHKGIGPGLVGLAAGLWADTAHAGMTAYDLTDIARLRIEDISFFGFLLVLATLGIRLLWNFLAKDFPRLPRLSFLKALSLTALLSIFMLLILVMIAGARELLTPGAWYRQGSHYRPNDAGNREMRQRNLESLRAALMSYAYSHQLHFPPHDYVAEIPSRLWEAADSTGTRYIYVGGLSVNQSNAVLVCEPANFGDERLVLQAGGKIQALKSSEIHRLLEVQDIR